MKTLEEAPEYITITDPRDGSTVGSVAVDSPTEVAATVQQARAAAGSWGATSPADRAGMLHAAASALDDRASELASLNQRETGRPLQEARAGVMAGVDTLRQYAELGPLHRGHRLQGDVEAIDYSIAEPRGVAVVITPWNDPVAVAVGLIGAALATGNVVVHKPSERCPHLGRLLGEVLAAEFPRGVLLTVSGGATVGCQLVDDDDVDVVAHVGSTAAGRDIARRAARTGAHVLRENGGNDPLIVDRGVSPTWAAEQAALGAFANSGQICTSVERIYVHRDVADAFVDALTDIARERNAGEGLAPLVDRRLRALVAGHVDDAVQHGARVTEGGVVPTGPGAHYPATVLTDCDERMCLMQEETFGPVAPVMVVEDFEEALRRASAGAYGLAATVLTTSMAHAQRAVAQLPAGTVKVNAVFGGAPGGSAQPRGESGSGFGYGPELLDEFTQVKVVHIAAGGGTA